MSRCLPLDVAVGQKDSAFDISPGYEKYFISNVFIATLKSCNCLVCERSRAASISSCPAKIPPVNSPNITNTTESSTSEKPMIRLFSLSSFINH